MLSTQRLSLHFGIHSQVLVWFRIGLGTLWLLQLIGAFSRVEPFFSDMGLLPLASLKDLHPETSFSTAWLWHVSPIIVLSLSLISTLLFILGIGLHIITPAAWFLCIAVQSRLELSLYGADDMIRLLFFWCIFLPLEGNVFQKKSSEPDQILSFGTVAILLQVVFFYFFAALAKTGVEWRSEGSAIFYALVNDQFSTNFGKWLTHFPDLLRLATMAVLGLEFASPVLLLLTTGYWRLAAVVLFAFFHLGIALTLELGLVPYTNLLALLLFVPLSLESRKSAKQVYFKTLGQGVAVVAMLYSFAWNSLSWSYSDKRFWHWPAYLLRIDQDWRFYAPAPSRSIGWWTFPATLADGTQIDAWTGKPVSHEIPSPFIRYYGGANWMTYHFQSLRTENAPQRELFLQYQCRKNAALLKVAYEYREYLEASSASDAKTYRLAEVECNRGR